MSKLVFILINFISVLFINGFIYGQTPVYLDPSASVEERVDDLLGRMTLEEKIGQMTQADHGAVGNMEDLKNYFIGSVLSGGGSDPSGGNTPLDWAELYDSFQQKALETRLGIPLIYGIDAVHGHSNVTGTVIFPHNIGMGATRNPALIEEAARITAIEIAATGIDWTFAPCIAVPRDERWGRTYEGFGETPELAELFAPAAVKGFQNDSLNSPTSIAACAKHYLADGGTLNGDDQGNAQISEEELRAIHLPGYIAAVENDAATVMASYSSWNGVKMHGNEYLLTDVLKVELGFDGFIISDWAAIDQLPGDYSSDVKASINAGIDMVMVPNQYVNFISTLTTLVQQEEISQARIDDAVSRILRIKFKLGLFENPYADRSLLPLVGSENHRSVGRQVVRESLVLLKKNDDVLPMPASNIRVLVAGEHADDIGLQCGGWTIQWQGAKGEITEGTTILEGLRKYAPGIEFVYNANGNFEDTSADYAIAVIGEDPYAEGAGNKADLGIDKDQINMVRNLKNLGIPVITILISGRPMIINPVLHNSDAFIAAWLPGTEADGIAQVLLGDYNPAGLLPFTWPKLMEQIPINFGDEDYDPLFPYGFGITSFDNSEEGSAPVFQSAMITEDGMHIELAFNKSMNNEGNTSAAFSVTRNGSENIDVINFELSGLDDKVLILELSEEIFRNDIFTLSYGSGNLASEDGGVLTFFVEEPVINFLDYAAGINFIPGRIEAEDYYIMNGVQTESTSDVGGGLNVGWIDDGDWLEYKCEIQNSGTYFVNFRVAALERSGTINFLVDGVELFSKTLSVTYGWQNWTTETSVTDLAQGEASIRINAETGGFNLNWFELVIFTSAENDDDIPSGFLLDQNYPNPFNPSTVISYYLPKRSYAELKLFDILGREVADIDSGYKEAGKYDVTFDASNSGADLKSGVYFYRLEAGQFVQTKKMLLIK